jgi:TonB-dependent SusC/RagA subfamily outer membrane receptor
LVGFTFSIVLSGREKTVQGKITTFKEIPVENAIILVKSTKQEFHSDSLGRFTLQCAVEDILIVTAEGFNKRRVSIKKETLYALVNLTLSPKEDAVEIAVGYGHVKDKNKLYAISSKNDNGLRFSNYRDIFELVEGNFPGVQVINREIIIRGSATFGSSNAALLIVDGRAVTSDSFAAILPSDIDNINILKDASSSVYGVKGGNGVVIVETKRGKQ